jgi:nucleoside 2-deoxyribosyltransferase
MRQLLNEAGPLLPAPAKRLKVFVLMPFAKDFEDVYVLGIRDVAEGLGLVVERADEIEHSENILDAIRARIRAADAIIGDTTGSNPNVFYEIGYAHALERPTLLIARKGSHVPFDLRSINHIMYETILELREGIKKRLTALMGITVSAACARSRTR